MACKMVKPTTYISYALYIHTVTYTQWAELEINVRTGFGVLHDVHISRAATWEVLETRWSKHKNKLFVKSSLG
jgi:uncharacterized membrane protein YcfT